MRSLRIRNSVPPPSSLSLSSPYTHLTLRLPSPPSSSILHHHYQGFGSASISCGSGSRDLKYMWIHKLVVFTRKKRKCNFGSGSKCGSGSRDTKNADPMRIRILIGNLITTFPPSSSYPPPPCLFPPHSSLLSCLITSRYAVRQKMVLANFFMTIYQVYTKHYMLAIKTCFPCKEHEGRL